MARPLDVAVNDVSHHVDGDGPASSNEGQQLELSLPKQSIQAVQQTKHWMEKGGGENIIIQIL